jgi:DNA-binding protein HU-beta
MIAKKDMELACICEFTGYRLWVRTVFFTNFQPLSMSKQDLINTIANAAGITKRSAAAALDALTTLVTKELKRGNSVTITGFGTFRVSKRAARTGVNPRNPSQKISIPAMKVPSFKAGKTLKDAVR